MYGRSTTLLASLAVLIVSLGQFTVLGFSVNLFQRTGRLVHLIRSPDAYTYTTHNLGPNNEGENHKHLTTPHGAEVRSVHVGSGKNSTVAVYQTKGVNSIDVTHAIIVIHGKRRNGDKYWSTFNKVVQKAREDRIHGSDRNVIVVAPIFFSTKYNSGQYAKDQLAWGDVNAWEAGATATHPEGTKLTSIDALDALVGEFSDAQKYPQVANITIVGHGGGGQLAQRYAMLGAAPQPHIHVRYVHGDASSCAYFTTDRPTSDTELLPTAKNCKLYNHWRYGFHKFPGTSDGEMNPQEFFKRYVTRDVVSIIGYRDVTKQNGDQFCMARIQGGRKRRDRNLTWYKYVNMLARTNETLDGFPGKFKNLPDWSHISGGRTNMRLGIVEDASHNAQKVFEGKIGQSALFNDDDIEEGWRPKR